MKSERLPLRYTIMQENKALIKRGKLSTYCIHLFGVKGVCWWVSDRYQDNRGEGLTVVLQHSWWAWRSLKNKNRARVTVLATEVYDESWAFIEVI